jgi:hypothetical protein
MKYFIDTHDRTKGSWPKENVTAEEFVEIYAKFEDAVAAEGGFDLGAHVNVEEGKAFCLTKGADKEAIRRAHERMNFPFDSITEVQRVSGLDLRPEKKQSR